MVVQDGGEIHSVHGFGGGLAEFERGDFFQAFDEGAEGAIVFIFGEKTVAAKVGVDHGDGSAKIANLVTNGGDYDSRSGHELLETGFFAVAKVLGNVDYDGGETRAGAGSIGGEPGVGKEDRRAVAAAAAAFDFGAERRRTAGQGGDISQGGQIVRDGFADDAGRIEAQKLMRGPVG